MSSTNRRNVKMQSAVIGGSTQSTPPTVEATSMAVPAMKGPAPLPSEQKAAE